MCLSPILQAQPLKNPTQIKHISYIYYAPNKFKLDSQNAIAYNDPKSWL